MVQENKGGSEEEGIIPKLQKEAFRAMRDRQICMREAFQVERTASVKALKQTLV